MAIDDMAKQASAGGESEVKFLTPLDINTKSEKKYCRFKKYGIKHVDYKDADFLLQFVNEQGKILPRRYTGTSLKYQRKVSSAIKRARHLALMPYVADLLKKDKDMAIDDMAKQASAGGESEVKFLTPLDINTKSEKKYCRFKKYGIKHVDYKDADFLLQFVNEQGKILPRRYTGTSLKYQRKVSSAIKRARHLALMPYVADLLK